MRDEKPVKGLAGFGSERPKAASVASARRGAGRVVESLRSYWDQHGRLALLLVAVTLVAYLPALLGQFVWDDDKYVTNNLLLRSLKGLWQIWFVPGATVQYYPLTFTSFWVDYHLWQLNPMGYHLTNVLLQALNAILLWTVLRRLNVRGTWLAAAIFALHPVGVESVAWVTERKNVLSAVFYFAAALAYLRFVAWEKPDSQNRLRWYWVALALFAAALLSKTVTCSLPAALLLVCWWKKGRVQRGDVMPLLPFFVAGVALGLTTAWIEKYHVGAQGADWSLTFADRCLIAGRALWFYAGKLVWPAHLTFIYPRWEIEPAMWWQWLFPIAAAGVVAGLWLARHRTGKGPLVAVLFFAGTLGPALGFVNVYPMRYSFVADHFQYLAGVGLIVLGAAGLNRVPRVIPAALVVLLGALTWQQAGIYRDLETLWRDTLAKNPDCWLAHNNLGMLLSNQGRNDEAMDHYHKAIQINPNDSEALNNLGAALAATGRFDEAIKNYYKAIQINPGFFKALNNLGLALVAQGRFDEAIENFHKAIQINPNHPNAFLNLGIALAQSGRTKEAAAQFREALKLNPELAVAMNNLAWILATGADDALRDGAEAVRLAERACELTHYDESLFIGTLAAAYAEAGRFPEAVTTAEKAEQLATSAGLTAVAAKNRQLLELYRAGKPYHEPAPTGH
jgi:Flp pilus assembly protein TadD